MRLVCSIVHHFICVPVVLVDIQIGVVDVFCYNVLLGFVDASNRCIRRGLEGLILQMVLVECRLRSSVNVIVGTLG